ncbi:MAG: hypothetical protein WCW40_09540, partial [Bacteroidota bacterium]
NVLSSAPWKSYHNGLTPYYTHRVRGENVNSVVVAGSFGEIITFNGMTWKSHWNQTQLQQANFYGVAFRNKTIIAVGEIPGRAIVVRGYGK